MCPIQAKYYESTKRAKRPNMVKRQARGKGKIRLRHHAT